ncbi:hypothetical protein ACTG2W_01510 [Aeromonas sp. 96A]|uniref:hypothetical protein n=1 Tax=Aeromonas TaxID=642 RepID=UPI00083BA20C|nr:MULTISPECIES: hypothetical protein [Aeromonas]MCR3972411.1 hypothetical protein [Aeromonas veronii]MCR3973745.1 hypothetical protein [Aeromonas veronii]
MDTIKMATIAGKVAFATIVPGYVKAIYSALSDSQDEVKSAESKGLDTLTEEANKQRIVMEFQAHQARVAQELAIAERIASSHEVQIEEFYDGSGKGSLGLKTEGESISLGASGEGRRVTRRIIRFTGCGPVERTVDDKIIQVETEL